LAIKYQQDPPLLLISADVIGFPRAVAEAVAARIHKEHQLPRANVLLSASHTHAGPVIDSGLKGMFDLPDKEAEAVPPYTRLLQEQAVGAAADALNNLAPAQLSFGRGRASFAANRRVFQPGGVNFGVNPDGPVDHEVPVLRAANPDGTVRAVVFGYACHGTTVG